MMYDALYKYISHSVPETTALGSPARLGCSNARKPASESGLVGARFFFCHDANPAPLNGQKWPFCSALECPSAPAWARARGDEWTVLMLRAPVLQKMASSEGRSIDRHGV